MDFKELTYVLALARHQSVTKAAQELYLTQPALTRFLQRLETSVGQPLFTRSGNRLIPTYAGEKYIERAPGNTAFEKTAGRGNAGYRPGAPGTAADRLVDLPQFFPAAQRAAGIHPQISACETPR